MKRLVRGLYHHHFGDRLIPSVDITVFARQYLVESDFNEFRDQFVARSSLITIGGSQFVYWYAKAIDNPFASTWVLLFQEIHEVVVTSSPRE